MKVLTELYPSELEVPPANSFALPNGLIGFEKYREAELLYQPDHLPFLWLRLISPRDQMHFIVIEPGGFVPNYEPELFDEHAMALDLQDASEAMVLNIVTLKHQSPADATVNLIGPIVINRRTRVGRQVVISNYSRYSSHYALVQQSQPVGQVTTR